MEDAGEAEFADTHQILLVDELIARHLAVHQQTGAEMTA